MFKKPTGSLAAFAHRDFTLFWTSASISNSAQWMQQFIIPVIIYDITESNTWVGLVAFGQLVPAFFFTPIAGVIADRIPRIKVLRITTSVQFVIAMIFFLFWQLEILTPGIILGLSLIQGVSAGLQIPNWQSLVPSLVPPKHLFSAIRLNSAQFTAARAVGPLTGAVLLNFVGEASVFLTNALTYLLLIAALLSMRPFQALPKVATKAMTAFKEGLKYVRQRKAIVQAISTAFMISFLGQSLVQLAAGLAEERYSSGTFGVAGFVTANGVGTILGSTLIIKFADRNLHSNTIIAGLLLYSIAPILSGSTGIYFIGLAGFFISGIAHMAVGISLNTAIQEKLPDAVRGRVISIYLMGVFGGIPLGSLLGGTLGDAIGLQIVYISYGIGFAVYLIVVIFFYKSHRALNENALDLTNDN